MASSKAIVLIRSGHLSRFHPLSSRTNPIVPCWQSQGDAGTLFSNIRCTYRVISFPAALTLSSTKIDLVIVPKRARILTCVPLLQKVCTPEVSALRQRLSLVPSCCLSRKSQVRESGEEIGQVLPQLFGGAPRRD